MSHTQFYRTLAALSLAAPLLWSLPGCGGGTQATQKEEQRAYWNNTRLGVLYQLATQQYQVGDYEKCRHTLKQAFALGYPHAPLQILAAKVELEKGSLEAAAGHLKTATQIDAANPEPYYLLGVVYQRWQNPQAAHDYYQIAYDKKPGEGLYLLALVELKISLNQLDEAQKLLDEKAVYFEQSAAVRGAQARLALLKNDYPKAVKYYREATLLCPEDLHLRQNYGEALYFAGRYGEALPVLEALHTEAAVQDRGSVQMVLGKTYMALHRNRDARTVFAEITRESPSNNAAWLQLAMATLRIGDYNQAAAVASRILNTEPDNTHALIILAVSQEKQGKWQDAAATLERAHRAAPKVATILCLLGRVSQHQGKTENATAYFNEALKVNPQDAWAQELLASGKTAEAPSVP